MFLESWNERVRSQDEWIACFSSFPSFRRRITFGSYISLDVSFPFHPLPFIIIQHPSFQSLLYLLLLLFFPRGVPSSSRSSHWLIHSFRSAILLEIKMEQIVIHDKNEQLAWRWKEVFKIFLWWWSKYWWLLLHVHFFPSLKCVHACKVSKKTKI